MTINHKKYLIPLDELDHPRILSTWNWLIGDKSIIALTKSGDALLTDNDGHLYFLETGGGTIEFKADNFKDFLENKLDEELMNELLLKPVIDRLEEQGKILETKQVYSYTMLPILGGKYDESNRFILDIYEHYNLTGDTHFQLKDTPDGTWVDVVVK